MRRVENPSGGYDFLTGISAFSSGVRARDGYEIVRAVFGGVVPWREGFDRVERQLESERVSARALCSVELRCSAPYSSDGFDSFNESYVERLIAMGVFRKREDNPVGRTNVAPLFHAPEEQGMFAFSYTRPATGEGRSSFIIAGGGEVRGGAITSDTIVRFGETSPDAIAEKTQFVLDVMEKRLTGLGLSWEDARMINVYTKHPIDGPVTEAILQRAGRSSVQGIHLFPTAPPVVDIEFEMDVKGPAWDLALP
jgi:hypothetical protein